MLCLRFTLTCLALTLSILASATHATTATPRIIGGVDAPANRWPWMAQLAIVDPNLSAGYLLCGASQISSRWILTAAHCMEYSNGAPAAASNVYVFIGDTDRNNNPASGIQAQQILVHRQYSNLNHDLALIRIPARSNTEWPSIISPSGIDALETAPFSQRDEAVTALGWGDTGSGISNDLQEVQLDYIPRSQCRQLSPLTISDFVICAAELNPVNNINQDSCFGDSGGPLFLGRDRSPWLAGVTSFGEPECATGDPGGYTHLAAETPELEALTASADLPLVDLGLSWNDTPPARYYLPPSGSIRLPINIANNGNNTINSAILTPALSGGTAAAVRWENCSTGLLDNACSLPGTLGAQATLSEALFVDGNNGPDQAVTLTVTGTSDEDDYRLRTNQIKQDIIFSNNPDIALTATQISSSSSVATARLTLKNLSTLNAASGGEVMFTLPSGMKLVNADDLSCLGTSPTICQLGNLPVNSQASLVLQLTGNPDSSRDLFFQGQVNEPDFPSGDANAKLTVRFASVATSSSGGSLWLWSLLPALALGLHRRRPCSPR